MDSESVHGRAPVRARYPINLLNNMTFDGISKSIVLKFFEKARTSSIIENMQILRVSFNSSGLPYELK